MKAPLTHSMIHRLLDYCYDHAVGPEGGASGAAELAREYAASGGSLEENIDALIRWQVAKCAAAGFVTGLGGLATIPVSLPADLFANLYVQVRMIAAIAIMCGHDIRSDRVKNLAFACLCGNAAADVVKEAGTVLSARIATAALERVTGRGVANLGKALPLLGGVVAGTIDATTCRIVGSAAKSIFNSTLRKP